MFVFNAVGRTRFGCGAINSVADACRELRISRLLIVTDQGIVQAGLLAKLTAVLDVGDVGYKIYDQVKADPPEQNLHEAVATGAGCNGVIGFGGGSSMDVAKLVAVLMASTQSLKEMYGVEMVTGGRLPLIQVPTTAGTGSEATAVSIITTGESTKAGVVSPVLFADQIILDPELTLGLPAHATAATGIDAMVHAIEAFTSVRLKNPLSDMVALESLRLLSANIETAVNDGSNLAARSDMLLGAMLAGQAFANAPVAAVHALAYPLGGTCHIAHGLSNSLMLPHVLRFNATACAPLYEQLAKAISGLDLADVNSQNIGECLANYFFDLATRLGLQTSLRDMQIGEDALPKLAELAMDQQRLLINNPREVTYEAALQLYKQAF